jgi:hypothetical protein
MKSAKKSKIERAGVDSKASNARERSRKTAYERGTKMEEFFDRNRDSDGFADVSKVLFSAGFLMDFMRMQGWSIALTDGIEDVVRACAKKAVAMHARIEELEKLTERLWAESKTT